MSPQETYSFFEEPPLFPIKAGEQAIIAHQYQHFLQQGVSVISDITWNDLDLDELYTQMNKTTSGAGDWMLYAMLRQPCIKQEDLNQRIRLMKWAIAYPEDREAVEALLSKCTKRYRDDLEQEYFKEDFHLKRYVFPYISWVVILGSLVLIPFHPAMFFLTLLTLCVSAFYYFYHHKQLEYQLDPLVYLVKHIDVLHRLANGAMSQIPEVQEELVQLSKQLSAIRKKGALGYFEDSAGLLNSITQREVLLYRKYAMLAHLHKEHIMQALALLGTIDACISAASYALRTKANQNILWTASQSIYAKDMIHPLVKDCVPNDVHLSQNMMLTGSNATGKSTFLKMVALNALLAQSFGFVYAKEYKADFFRIETSMTIHDQLTKGESTFVAEGKSLKTLLDAGTKELPALCVIDEILRGTNTLDRISASAVILKEFTRRNARCLIATHDIELTGLLANWYTCAHFSEQMKDGIMRFDYKLHPGVTTTRNAIDLLEVFDYDASLISSARKRLKAFEATGVWECIS